MIFIAAFLLVARLLPAQSGLWHEGWVASEIEMYTRVLALQNSRSTASWSIRALSQGVQLGSRNDSTHAPWAHRLQRAAHDSQGGWWMLRPYAATSFNSAFPWGFNDGALWQGRGLNVWATGGMVARWRAFSMRFEPVVMVSANRPFALHPLSGVENPYGDPMRPGSIDLPQRLGERSRKRLGVGQSFLRYDFGGANVTVSNENLFWGPALRHPLLLGPNAEGFPHVTLGTNAPVQTRLGRWHAQLLYGRLSESAWAPVSQQHVRLGSGMIVAWMPSAAPIEIGVARFAHTRWSGRLSLHDLLVPFTFLIGHDSVQQADEVVHGTTTNELASAFFRVRAASGLELFGEFGRSDRPEDLRDMAAELEHNSAWSLGMLATSAARKNESLWSFRFEYVNGRIASISRIGRSQGTFYEHGQWSQGHTVGGQLLGTPLLERASGSEAALDRWSPSGRVGVALFQRQLPEDEGEGMREAAARTQWDLGLTAVRFFEHGDLTLAFGSVLDINRLPGRDGRNTYAGMGWRMSLR